ncbi:MAG: bifunctional 2-polyprenyl-6-hydroxyphenol methylase/3-demethylubiquinol 3-O-methyltransferase UbiG [Pseudomonadaceae bacterium]|nr:bifunctional 2-polyprenyl-6-hydroxyphenol methylase/3-demethylubiquinol 3-O-methyltransferase UbiG [Pseudomonadaceae bacterium]
MTQSAQTANINDAEVAKFEALAHRWWDAEGEFKPLHDINPLRLNYTIDKSGGIEGKRILDIGCGGGILSESMAKAGAIVTGIDAGEAPLTVARLHALESGSEVTYEHITVEALAAREGENQFDVITCLEMLEHVPDPASILRAASTLLKPGGELILSTINRHPKAYVFAILGAEYVLGLLPKGTHDYASLIKPSELAAAVRAADMVVQDIRGMNYNPLTRVAELTSDTKVNYLMHAHLPEASA